MRKYVTLAVLCMAYMVAGISIKMEDKRIVYCYKVEVGVNAILDGSYLVSGESEDQITARVSSGLHQ